MSDSGNQIGETNIIDKISIEKTKEKIQKYSELIRNKEVEHVYVIDRLGNVFYSVGNQTNFARKSEY